MLTSRALSAANFSTGKNTSPRTSISVGGSSPVSTVGTDAMVRIQVPRAEVAGAAGALLERFPVADLSIEEEDVGNGELIAIAKDGLAAQIRNSLLSIGNVLQKVRHLRPGKSRPYQFRVIVIVVSEEDFDATIFHWRSLAPKCCLRSWDLATLLG